MSDPTSGRGLSCSDARCNYREPHDHGLACGHECAVCEGRVATWCPCWEDVAEPTGPWQYPDDLHADTHDVLLAERRAVAGRTPSDWTVGPDGASNTSEEFRALCKVIENLIRSDAHMLISGHADSTARLILANLAHKHGMTPARTPS